MHKFSAADKQLSLLGLYALRPMRLVSATTILLLAATAGLVVVAQGGRGTPSFEVASIRRVDDRTSTGWIRITPRGQLVGQSTLKNLIVLAYEAEPYERVIAADSAAASSLETLFDVNALPPESSPAPDRKEVSAMTRQLLEERFGLKVRVDSDQIDGTVLRMITSDVFGPGLRPAPEGCARLPPDAQLFDEKSMEALGRSCVLTMFGRVRGTVTLDEFARVISFATGRPILNRTNLEGMYAIDVNFDLNSLASERPSRLGPRVPAPAGQSEAPAFIDALRNQMGIAVRTERQSIRLFVVEHVGPFAEN